MKNLIIGLFLLIAVFCSAQSPINVAELTIKIKSNSTEELYYGFAEGDQIIFSLEEINGKKIKEVEISEYPKNTKFTDYEAKKIEEKRIDVLSKGVYKFRIRNSHRLRSRVCRIKIQRIPASKNTRKFNTKVKWVTAQDTIWKSRTENVIARYDTLFIQKTRRIKTKEEKVEEIIFDKTQRVHSYLNGSGTTASLHFNLPDNFISENETKKVIAWAYWVGVGEESTQAWEKNMDLLSLAAEGAASLYLTPLGAFAVGAVTTLVLPTTGQDIAYGIVNEYNQSLFKDNYNYETYDTGKGIAGFKKFTDEKMMQGKYYIILSNDNMYTGVDVNVKVSAIIEHIKYEDEVYNETKVTPKYGTKIISDPIITTKTFPATFDYK
jgi:hypothetical protein